MIQYKFPKNIVVTFQQCRLCSSGETKGNVPKSFQKKENEVISTEKYDPKQVTKEDMMWKAPWQKEKQHFGFLRVFYKEESHRHVIQKLQTPIDLSPSAIKKWWAEKKEEKNVALQSYIPLRNQILGNELAAAHFIVYRGGAVKFNNEDKWIKANEQKEYTLPRFYEEGKILEALDCSNMSLVYEGLVNLDHLKQVEWLSLNGCEEMDDWCMDKISNIFSHSLIYLDLRNCPKITAKGIGALYKLRKLKVLYLDDFFRSSIYEMTCLLLQEANPELDIKSDPVVF